MRRESPLKVLSEVRDLQIVDNEGRNCGICDDIEFEGGVGERLRVRVLLVGPGAFSRRLPGWAARLAVAIAGRSMVRVPWDTVEKISGRIVLSVTAESVGLRRTENRLVQLLQRAPMS
jgi:sporulation protein YlmC with PRC-barrel domain